jgi:hypothetical protein
VNTHHETLELPANDPIMLQLAISYCEYCDSVIGNRMRAYRLAKMAVSEAIRLEQQPDKPRPENKLLSVLEAFVLQVSLLLVIMEYLCSYL